MRDFNQPLRKAIYTLLNNQLTYGGNPVPVFDEKVKKGQDNQFYVVIGNISSTDNSTFANWSRNVQFVLDIITKTSDTVTRKIADNIAEQILILMMPTIVDNGLSQTNFQYINCQLDSDRYLDMQLNPTTAQVRRLLTFSITANQTS